MGLEPCASDTNWLPGNSLCGPPHPFLNFAEFLWTLYFKSIFLVGSGVYVVDISLTLFICMQEAL
jgi:hypothetical protein